MPNDHPSLESVNFGAPPTPTADNRIYALEQMVLDLQAKTKVLQAFHHWTATQALPQLLSLTESNQQQIRDLVTHLQAFNQRLSDCENKLFTPHDPI